MTKNESKTDRIIRAVVGLILLYIAYFVTTDGLSTLLYFLAVITIITAITGFCALYKVFGISTVKK